MILKLALWIRITKGAVTDTTYGLVAIDHSTKFAEVVPMKNKTPEAIIIGCKKHMVNPKQLYSDEE